MITLTNIVENKQKLLDQLQILGFINLKLAIYQGELYFLVDRNPNVEGASIEGISLLEGIYKIILGCNLSIRMQSTTEESFWITLQENSVSIDNIILLPQKFKLHSTDEITFEELSGEDMEQLRSIPERIKEEQQHLKIKDSGLFLSGHSMFAPQEHSKTERVTQSAFVGEDEQAHIRSVVDQFWLTIRTNGPLFEEIKSNPRILDVIRDSCLQGRTIAQPSPSTTPPVPVKS